MGRNWKIKNSIILIYVTCTAFNTKSSWTEDNKALVEQFLANYS